MKKPFILLINGPIGAGKTTLSNYLKKKLPKKTVFLDIDNIKYYVNSFEKTIYYHNITREVLIAMVCSYIKRNINVVISSSWPKKFTKILKDKNRKTNYVHLFLFVGLKKCIERARKRNNKREIKHIRKNYDYYSVSRFDDAIPIDTNKKIPAVRKEVMKILAGKIA